MKKILLVDDDHAFNTTLKEFLELKSFEVINAFDGQQGFNLLQQEAPDLIITDLIMPNVEGIEFINGLKQSTASSLKVIAISGGGRIGSADYLKVAKEIGADEVFTKPLKLDEFVAAINNLLD